MSRDLSILSSNAKVVAAEEMLAALRTRRMAVEWQPRTPIDPSCLEGALTPAGSKAASQTISIWTERVDALTRNELLSVYASSLTADVRRGVTEAVLKYKVSTSLSADSARDKLLGQLIDVLLEWVQGVVYDPQEDRLYTHQEFRAQSAIMKVLQ